MYSSRHVGVDHDAIVRRAGSNLSWLDHQFAPYVHDKVQETVCAILGCCNDACNARPSCIKVGNCLNCYLRSRMNSGKWTSPTCICHKDAGGTS